MSSTDRIIRFGEKHVLKSDFGPVSFGLVLSGAVVSWSAPAAKDLLIGRCWKGIFLYPSAALGDDELAREPMEIFPSDLRDGYVVPVDWNRDGREDMLGSNRTGFLFRLERQGEFPDPAVRLAGHVSDARRRLLFNIPYENPNHPVQNNLGGYFDRPFFNYLYPVIYPPDAGQVSIDLVIGDWAGFLWWLPDQSGGRGEAVYDGIPYDKPADDIVTEFGRGLVRQHGLSYVKPRTKIKDESGAPILLGEGLDSGVVYDGCNARPVLYRNNLTGSNDLMVIAGAMRHRLCYLQRAGSGDDGEPVFRNCGEVVLDGMSLESAEAFSFEVFGFHTKIIVFESDGWNDLMITAGAKIAVFRNKRRQDPLPQFQFSHWISGREVVTTGYNYTEILTERSSGKRYLLDNVNRWEFREVVARAGDVRVSSAKIPLEDQSGVFSVEGETDPQLGKSWGFHRAARWDFDGSGRQHLIVGTDKGLLYLLIEESDVGTDGKFRFRSVGPLSDRGGSTIKVHNRTRAVGVDVNGDGREDLIVGGATYQLGVNTDPNPGGGIYYCLNAGLDRDGAPILDPPRPLPLAGLDLRPGANSHVHLQVADVDGDGEDEIVVAIKEDSWYRGRVYRIDRSGIGLTYTGTYMDEAVIDQCLLDIDGDGVPEHVFAGGEQGVGCYRKLVRG